MTTKAQRDRELAHVREMVALLPVDIDDDPTPLQPPNKPDFELRLSGSGTVVGLEETAAIDGAHAKAWNETRALVESGIKRELARDSIRALVSSKVEVAALIDLGDDDAALANLVKRAATYVRGVVRQNKVASKSLLQSYGIEHLRYLQVDPSPMLDVYLVTRAAPAGTDRIQLAINKKAKKLGRYQSHVADEYWLLVVGGEPIVSYVPAGDIRDHVFTSPYKRTLFLDRADRTCFELRTTTP